MPVLILIAAILGTAVLGEGGYIAAKKIEKYKTKIILQENILKYAVDALSAQQKELEKIKDGLNIAQKGLDKKTKDLEKTITTETKNLEERINRAEMKSAAVESARKAQEESAQNKISALEEKISQTKTYSLSSIISDWRPLIANLECQFRYSNTGRIYQKSSGSGIAIKFKNTPSAILTNKHVLTDSNGYGADSCSAKLLDSDETLASSDIRNSSTRYYPRYIFINSEKVEEGNSGGAAILLKDNCLLGIPTFVTLGKVESLARILDIWTAVEK